MTKYWPTSQICGQRTPNCKDGAEYAWVIQRTIPVESPLQLVHGSDGTMARIYAKPPSFDAWRRLERGGFIEIEPEKYYFLLDNLH